MGPLLTRTSAGIRGLLRSLDFGSVTKWVFFAALIGVAAGLAGIGFKWLIHVIKDDVFRPVIGATDEGVGGLSISWWIVLAVPTIGGLVTGIIVQSLAPEAEGHGTDSVVHAFHVLKGKVRKRVIVLKALTSAITIGSGGSAGQEGPVAQVGAGVGSALADTFKLTRRDRRIFLLSGASAGIGAMFCSPLGGALFMPEVVYRKPEFEGDAIIPCIISSIFAYATLTAISGDHRAIPIEPELLASLSFDSSQILLYLFLSIACTAVGWLYVRTFYGIHRLFNRLTVVPKSVRPAIGGLLLGLTALVIAPYCGVEGIFFGGYGLMTHSIAGVIPAVPLLVLILAKILATSFTISTGGSGGVFAPSLAIGALVGAAVGSAAQTLFPGLEINPACFAMVGMGGFFAGVAKVPVAAVIMVCEMSGNYSLLAPLMLVSVVHVLLSQRWSLYEAQVSGIIDSPAHAGDFVHDILADMKVGDILEEVREPTLIHENTTLGRVIHIVADARDSYFPVIDDDERLTGIFSLTDLRRIYKQEVVEEMVIVRDFMNETVSTVELSDSLDEVLHKLTSNSINAIPVMKPDAPDQVLGILDRNEIGRAYDRHLRELKTADDATD